jgi:alpha-galactosidase
MSLRFLFLLSSICSAADLTGNWVVPNPNPAEGTTTRNTYFDLKQEGSRITGHIRTGQFYYTVKENTGGPEEFTLTGSMMDGKNERTVKYEGKLVGEELRLETRRRPDAALTAMIAHRAPAGEGAYPAKVPLPALHKVPDNGLAKTPPMGWNSWNKFAGRVDDAGVRSMADAMASNGMKEAGYVYVNIDDTWEADRDPQGNIRTNKKFPDMKGLADYVHGKGLKLGIYSSPGPNTCAGYEGSYRHEEQDARTYAAWGIDYLKYDWCGARNLYTDEEMQAVYQKMGDALRAAGRPILYSLCQYGRADVWKWGPDVGGNAWRTTGDIKDTWDSMSTIGFSQSDLSPWAKPGHWNDPDMLEIGNGGMNDTEYQTHMSLWSILAAPLLAGNDLRSIPPNILAILTNRDVIAIDQDKDGKQGKRVWKSGDQEIWVRELAGGDKAVAVFNRAADKADVTIKWSELGLKTPSRAKDLWAHRDTTFQGAEVTTSVPGHGVMLWRVR